MKIKIDKLDKLFRQVLLLRDDFTCQVCGKKYDPYDTLSMRGLHTSHFKGRRMKSVRWDLQNADLMCFGCHQHMHENPDTFVDWKESQLGSETFEKLVLRACVPVPITKARREEVKDRLTQFIKELSHE